MARIVASVALCWLTLTAGCDRSQKASPTPATSQPSTKLRVQLKWFDSAQFIGFYVAAEKGYFKNENLEVELVPGGFNHPAIPPVEQGQCQLGVGDADLLIGKRAEGIDVRVIGCVFNKSVACFMSRTSLNVRTPADLVGKKVGVFRGDITENTLYALLQTNGIERTRVDIIDAGPLEAFKKGDIEVWPAYLSNEPLRMKAEGIDVSLLMPDDFGVHFYSDALFTTDKFLNNNRDAVLRFIRGAARGWSYAREHPEEAVELMYDYIKGQESSLEPKAHQVAMTRAVTQLVGGPEGTPFVMERERWKDMEDSLKALGIIDKTGVVEELVDLDIAREAQN